MTNNKAPTARDVIGRVMRDVYETAIEAHTKALEDAGFVIVKNNAQDLYEALLKSKFEDKGQ